MRGKCVHARASMYAHARGDYKPRNNYRRASLFLLADTGFIQVRWSIKDFRGFKDFRPDVDNDVLELEAYFHNEDV